MSLRSGDGLSVGSPFVGTGFTIGTTMVSAVPSRGIVDPAACLAVREDWARSAQAARKPSVAHRKLTIEPFSLVGEPASELPPTDVADSPGQPPTGEKVGDLKVLDGQPAVALGELTGDLMKEASP